MRKQGITKLLPYIVPFVSIVLLASGLYFILKVFNNHPERLVGDVLLITGITSLIMTFTVSIASTQLFEAIIYIIYRIRKLANPRLNQYDDPESFKEFHEHVSTEGFIFTLPAYLMSIITLCAGIIYLKYFVIVAEELFSFFL
ncbi:MAG TPA: hypothetical protein PKG96_08580 [Bacilli bacterium]|jgi:hypothetical protein|nr:hypothetical protein [Bacilli bacterium]HOD62138.1 hypothetical protein [Bacilli bacterium]HOH62319.1 hypothetical protein [Bacilli bacterium]HPB49226.1 hypothetical protein [Bacilli bacterium]HPM15500.1 hypothetical protein [Bacilli bacterium]